MVGRHATSRIAGRAQGSLVRAAGIAIAALLALAARAASAEEQVFALDRAQSRLNVCVYRAGVLSRLAHDHTFMATAMDARILLDDASPVRGSVSLRVDATGLEEVAGALSEAQRAEVRETMLSARVLDAARFPEIAFDSSAVEVLGEEEGRLGLRILGTLSLHGERRAIEVSVLLDPVAPGNGAVRASGEAGFLQSDFGIEPYSAYLGAVRVRDEVRVVFDLTLARAG